MESMVFIEVEHSHTPSTWRIIPGLVLVVKLITMVSFCPLTGVVRLPLNGLFMSYKWGLLATY